MYVCVEKLLVLNISLNIFVGINKSIYLFWDRISLCGTSCPGAYYVYQAGPKLTGVCLPLPLNRIKGVCQLFQKDS